MMAWALVLIEAARVDKRVVNGTDVKQGTYTYAVKLTRVTYYPSIYMCSGNIITSEWILTAGHCCGYQNVTNRFVIEAGNPNVEINVVQAYAHGVPADRQVVHSNTCIPHPNYDKFKTAQTAPYDIGLVKLSKPLDLKRPNISAVNLPNTGNSSIPIVGDAGDFVGFGLIDFQGTTPTVGQHISMAVGTVSSCEILYAIFEKDYHFCGNYTNTKRLMNGDSGGGFVMNYPSNPTVFGVLSKGRCDKNVCYPSIFVRTTTNINWIRQQIGANHP